MSVLNDILNAGVASGAAPGLVAMSGNAAGVKWSGVSAIKMFKVLICTLVEEGCFDDVWQDGRSCLAARVLS